MEILRFLRRALELAVILWIFVTLCATSYIVSAIIKESRYAPLIPEAIEDGEVFSGVRKMRGGVCGQERGSCIIRDNPGGNSHQYEMAAEAVKRLRIRVRIAGECNSACALFADLARPNVCIEGTAQFAFHLGTVEVSRQISLPSWLGGYTIALSVSRRLEPQHSSDIQNWVTSPPRKGFPVDGVLSMSALEAVQFWPRC